MALLRELVKVQVFLAEALLEKFLASDRGNQILWYLCGKTTQGHSYEVGLLTSEITFVLDPHIGCQRCGMPMNEAQYDQMVTTYANYLDELVDEDEAW